MAICTSGSSSNGWLYCGEGEPVRPQGAGSPPASPFPPPAARPAHLRYQPLHERLETALALLELLQQPEVRQTLSIHGAGRSPPGLSPPLKPTHRSNVPPPALIGPFKSIYATGPARVSGRLSQGALPAETKEGPSGRNMRTASPRCTAAPPRGVWASCPGVPAGFRRRSWSLSLEKLPLPSLGGLRKRETAPNNCPERSQESQCS